MPLPVDIVLERTSPSRCATGVTIYVDVFVGRPRQRSGDVAWSPYGKSRGHAPWYVELFGLLGMETSGLSGLMKFEGPDPASGARMATPSATRITRLL